MRCHLQNLNAFDKKYKRTHTNIGEAVGIEIKFIIETPDNINTNAMIIASVDIIGNSLINRILTLK